MKLKLDYVSNQPQKIHADTVEQVHVSIKFGEHGFSGFGDFAFFVCLQIGQISLLDHYSPW